MSYERRFNTAWDVAKWIEANVPDYKAQGHADPIEAALWYQAAQEYEAYRDMSGREWIEAVRGGIVPTQPSDITNDINAMHEDNPDDPAAVDEAMESSLRDFWFTLKGEQ